MTPVEPFPVVFAPYCKAIDALVAVANDPASPHGAAARAALDSWRAALASPSQIKAARHLTSDDVEIDSVGACTSEGDDGFFIQTWSWVKTAG